MSARRASFAAPALRRERGMALITGLLLLLVVTIIGMSMFRSYGVQEKIAGNVREKQRAVNAAVSAQQYAEVWLSSGAAPTTGGTCAAGTVPQNVGQVCNNAPADFTAVPWFTAVTFDTFNQTIAAAPSAGTYYKVPQYFVTFLGTSAGGNGYFQIDAAAWGGTPNSVAVVESTYEVVPSGGSLDK
jgi:type IV pilus assembly protein PilX